MPSRGDVSELSPRCRRDVAEMSPSCRRAQHDVLVCLGGYNASPASRSPTGSRHGSQCKSGFRETRLVFGSKAPYFLLCAFNFSLRFVWTVSVFGGLPGRGYGMFVFEVLEIARRTAWAVFRIEWEVVVKVCSREQPRAADIS